ncbi:GFA family protein [Ferrimonas sediminicola]|uniref:GFA family protein n=1 Tax=Ferrimonas sediminicola TaxID=2569538 RepID=A0A4U1BGZ0_9GAMM|nr:GFA family protein [Ferrimonas sediminicola]TKB50294.1 GFA family protein [Ferrimonas sediminicola]
MKPRHKGSCLCGKVHYEITGECQSLYLCHCHRCQKGSGSVHGANLFAQDASLTWIQGAASVTTYHHPGTLHVRSFCRHCGSALPSVDDRSGWVTVPAGSLDTPVPISVTAKIFTASRGEWVKSADEAPSFDALPQSEGQ